MNGEEADSGFVIGIDIEAANGNRVAVFIHHHLMMRQRIPGVTLGPQRLVQRLTQHLPAELVVGI
ncbi:hypothetical protein GCM10027361_43410 [Erwinia aphidicola]